MFQKPEDFFNRIACTGGNRKRDLGIKMDGRGGTTRATEIQILLVDKNATYLCSKTICTLKDSEEKIKNPIACTGGNQKRHLGIKMDGRGGTRDKKCKLGMYICGQKMQS